MMLQRIPLGTVSEIIMGQSPNGDSYNRSGVGTPLLNGPYRVYLTAPSPCPMDKRAYQGRQGRRSVVLRSWFDHRTNELG